MVKKTFNSTNTNGTDYKLLIADMQLSFLHFILLSNPSSQLQFELLLKLVSHCHKLVGQRPDLFYGILEFLSVATEYCPEDFLPELAPLLKHDLRKLRHTIEREYDRLNQLADMINKIFDILPHSIINKNKSTENTIDTKPPQNTRIVSLSSDDDNDFAQDNDTYSDSSSDYEQGEYAPVVVEIGTDNNTF